MSKRTRSKPAEAAEPKVYRKPRADVYTMLLVVALIAAVLATVSLWMSMKIYDYKLKGGPAPTWHLPAARTIFDAPTGLA